MLGTQALIPNDKMRETLDIIETITCGDFMQNIVQLNEDPKNVQYIPWNELSNSTDSTKQEDNNMIYMDDMDYDQRIKIMRKGARIFYSRKQLVSTLQIINTINDKDLLDEISKNKNERDVKSKEWKEIKKEIQDILSGSANMPK